MGCTFFFPQPPPPPKKVKRACFKVNKQRDPKNILHPWDLSYFVLEVVKTLGLKSASLLSDDYANKLPFIDTTV